MPHIYKITSPNKKVYVGSTTNINERFASYKRLKCKSQIRLYNSLKKHGSEKHIFEIITECNIDEMLSLECYYGNLYNTLYENGLNCVLPNKDEKFICRSKETRERLSKSNKGKIVSQETRQILREINLGKTSKMKGVNFQTPESRLKMSNSHKGKILPDYHKKNISNALKGKMPKNHSKIINDLKKVIIDYNYGIFHESINDCAMFFSVSASLISMMLSGKRKNKFNIHISTN